MYDDIDTDRLYAHVAPCYWPILWWNIILLRLWHHINGNKIDAIELSTSRFGQIHITKIYPRSDHTVTHMRAFKACSENWTLDQLGHIAAQFARANKLRPCDVCALLREIINASGFPRHPAINDSS